LQAFFRALRVLWVHAVAPRYESGSCVRCARPSSYQQTGRRLGSSRPLHFLFSRHILEGSLSAADSRRVHRRRKNDTALHGACGRI